MTRVVNKDQRSVALLGWAHACLLEVLDIDIGAAKLESVSGDASFRRYFRLRVPTAALQGKALALSYILVDAPPQKEDCHRFVRIADTLRAAGLAAPVVHHVDYLQGFMLLQDFGDALYLPLLLAAQQQNCVARAEGLYLQAIEALLTMQSRADVSGIPIYDQTLLRTEMSLFDSWFCQQFLATHLSVEELALIERTYTFLEKAALAQPRVFVHRDYHSRNLMIRDSNEAQTPGLIDFQDAVAGPPVYDLVSLLRDCYIVWPREQVRDWALHYLQQAKARGIIAQSCTDEQFLRDFDLMGLQRHLKVIGIFCRLSLRDGKSGFLADVPRVIHYVLSVAENYSELREFTTWFRARLLLPAMQKLNAVSPPEISA